jgi:hypothetical protein
MACCVLAGSTSVMPTVCDSSIHRHSENSGDLNPLLKESRFPSCSAVCPYIEQTPPSLLFWQHTFFSGKWPEKAMLLFYLFKHVAISLG